MRSITALLLAGGFMAAIASPVSAQTPFSVTATGGAIPDANLMMFSLTLPDSVLEIATIELDIAGLTHTNPEDLAFELFKPTVAGITLMQDQGDGITVNGIDLTFSDLGSDAAPIGGPLADGATYRPLSGPSEGFNKFVGNNGAGNWILLVTDDSAGDVGSFDSWTLRGTYVPEPMTMSLLALGGAVAVLRRKRS